MMYPLKFVTATLLSIIGSLILLWLTLAVVFSIQTENRKKDTIVPPSVSWLNAANDIIANSLFPGHKFSDEIKGYYMELIDEKNMTFSVYMANRKYTNMLPPVMIAVNYTGDKEFGHGTATIKFTANSFGYG